MCIVGVIAGGHYDQGRDSECKAYYYFYIHQFACIFDLPDCTFTDVDDNDCHYELDLLMMVMLLLLLLSLLNVFSPLQGL